jgi:hypothetical protein
VSWKIESDPDDPDQQSILFTYPTALEPFAGYLRTAVKIELGARSDTEPVESAEVKPYLADAFPDALPDSTTAVRAVSPRRTFLEKAMLLHEESFRPPEKRRKARLSRHYYDLCRLIQSGVGDEARGEPELFARIVAHREIYFRYTWVDYETLKPGALRLVPPDDQIDDWRSDYEDMAAEMFSDEVPTFDEIVRVVREFEQRWHESR